MENKSYLEAIGQPKGHIWPGVVDHSLQKLFDVAIPFGKRILLPEATTAKTIPLRGEPDDVLKYGLPIRLGDDHLLENVALHSNEDEKNISDREFNKKTDEIAARVLLSARNWR